MYIAYLIGLIVNCVCVTQQTTIARNVGNHAAIFAVNLEWKESFSTEDVSPLPEGKFVKHMYDLDNVPDNLYNLMFYFRTQNITEKLRQVMTMRQDEGSDGDGEREQESRPRPKRQLPPSQTKAATASDDSMESVVDDSDKDCDYKEESSEDDSSEPSDDDFGEKTTDPAHKKIEAKTL